MAIATELFGVALVVWILIGAVDELRHQRRKRRNRDG